MPSPAGALIFVCVLGGIVGFVFAKIVYDIHRAMSDPTDEKKQTAREHYLAMKGEQPTISPDKKPAPKRYFGEP